MCVCVFLKDWLVGSHRIKEGKKEMFEGKMKGCRSKVEQPSFCGELSEVAHIAASYRHEKYMRILSSYLYINI